MIRFDIVLYDGVDELDVIGPLEVVRSAIRAGAGGEVRLRTRFETPVITCSFGVRILPDGVFEPGSADVVIVPGGGWVAKDTIGTWGEVERGEWLPLLKESADSGTTMVSVCTGAMLLAHAGIIGKRPSTTHSAAREDLIATGATFVDDRVVDDGDLITGAGVTSGLDIGLHLVGRYFGSDAKQRASTRIEYPPRC